MIFNDVVRAFIWSPHTQMFNLLLPALGVALILADRRRTPARLCLYALGIGVGILAYAAWALVFPCLVIAEAWARRGAGWRAGGWRLLGLLVAMAMLCALPTVLWLGFLRVAVGPITMPETSRYHEVVWIVEALRVGVGAFVAAAVHFLTFFVVQFLRQGIPAFVALGLALWLGRGQQKWPEAIRPAAFAAGVVALVCIGFFTFIGWPAPRLGYPAVVAIIMLAGVVAVRRRGDAVRAPDPARGIFLHDPRPGPGRLHPAQGRPALVSAPAGLPPPENRVLSGSPAAASQSLSCPRRRRRDLRTGLDDRHRRVAEPGPRNRGGAGAGGPRLAVHPDRHGPPTET